MTVSLPIILIKRPDSACVAKELAGKGYCATEKLDYHGLKLHLVGVDRLSTMPLPEFMQFSRASINDLAALRQQLHYLSGGCLVGDKAYASTPLKEWLLSCQQLDLATPIKRKKGKSGLTGLSGFSRGVSVDASTDRMLFQLAA